MRVLLAAALVLALAFPASAQEWDCTDASNLPQQGLNHCAWIDFEEADRALNVAWELVKEEIDARDADMPEQWKGWGKALLDAQRAWITYRDAHCEAEGFQVRGGSMEPLIVATCKTHETRERIQDLLLLIETY